MKRILYFLLFTLLFLVFSAGLRGPEKPSFIEGEILVKFQSGMTTEDVQNALSSVETQVLQYIQPINLFHVKIKSNKTVQQAIDEFLALPNVIYAEPNYILSINRVPNDPKFSELWALENNGQSGGLAGADISAAQAWDISTGSEQVLVGVIDTGVDYTHNDLAPNIYTNPGEDAWSDPFDPTTGNGVDDDGNGKIDDWKGWNFIDQSNNPYDDNMHGSHCAGTIGAVGNNNIGVTGICWNVKIMPLKFLDAYGNGSTSAAILAITYASDMGVQILNNSYGSTEESTPLKEAIEYANERGVLFVAAAGNDGTNNDLSPHFPSNYEVPNIIAVAASDDGDQRAIWGDSGGGGDDCGFICASVNAATPGSNYGFETVDLFAPGKNILSTIPGDGYSKLSGTSMASPHLAGAAALVLSTNSSLSTSQLKQVLLSTVDKLDEFTNLVATGGRLNLASAVNSVNN